MANSEYSMPNYLLMDIAASVAAASLCLIAMLFQTPILAVLYTSLLTALFYAGVVLMIIGFIAGIASIEQAQDGRWVHGGGFVPLGMLFTGWIMFSMSALVEEWAPEVAESPLTIMDHVAVYGLLIGVIVVFCYFAGRIVVEISNRKEGLLEAAERGNIKQVKRLLRRGVDINTRDWTRSSGGRSTALIGSASRGHTKVVELLLDNGADKGIEDQWGRNALYFAKKNAVEDERDAIVKLLLENEVSDTEIPEPSKSTVVDTTELSQTRNSSCSCGSGKRYKNCCGRIAR